MCRWWYGTGRMAHGFDDHVLGRGVALKRSRWNSTTSTSGHKYNGERTGCLPDRILSRGVMGAMMGGPIGLGNQVSCRCSSNLFPLWSNPVVPQQTKLGAETRTRTGWQSASLCERPLRIVVFLFAHGRRSAVSE